MEYYKKQEKHQKKQEDKDLVEYTNNIDEILGETLSKGTSNDTPTPSPEPSVDPVPIDPNQPPADPNKKIVGLQNDAGINEWLPYYDDGTNKYIISWDSIPKTSVSDEIQSKECYRKWTRSSFK